MNPDDAAVQPPTTDELERERIRRRLEEFAITRPASDAMPSGSVPWSPASGRGKRRARPVLKPRLPR